MIKKKLLTVLPLTENYSKSRAGAVSLFVKDNNKCSIFSNFVIGSTSDRDIISKNYKNIKVFRSLFALSKNINYAKQVLHFIRENNFDLIEVHNRPQIAKYLIKNNIKRVSLFFHNDPLKLRNSKTKIERKFLLDNCIKIYFNSKWTRSKFFEDFKNKSVKKTYVVYQGIITKFKLGKKSNIIVFAGKLNKSKGFDVFCHSIPEVLNKFPKWRGVIIGNEPREKYNCYHKNLTYTGWLDHKKVINIFKKSSILVVNSNWEEPFGRVAVEGAATGNAIIMTKRGGLPETTKYKVFLKKNNKDFLVKELSKLISNPDLLSQLQKKTFKSFEHNSKKIITRLDQIRHSI